MVELNHRQRTIKIKIVYYGPPVCGKTTNLQVLHQHADAQRRGELVSINSAQDRTILFDLLPLKVPGFRGFDLRLQVLTVPGQAMYAATRRLVLKGADSVVFVANSATDRWEENLQSLREMTDNLLLHQLDPATLPMVLQYNKRDLPATTAIEQMDRVLNTRKVDALPAVAVTGQGVLETFAAVLSRTVYDLAVRYQIVDVGRGQPLQQWTRQAMLGMFGATSLTEEAPLFESAGGMPLVTTVALPRPAPAAIAAPAASPAPTQPQPPAGPLASAGLPPTPATAGSPPALQMPAAASPPPSARLPALPATPATAGPPPALQMPAAASPPPSPRLPPLPATSATAAPPPALQVPAAASPPPSPRLPVLPTPAPVASAPAAQPLVRVPAVAAVAASIPVATVKPAAAAAAPVRMPLPPLEPAPPLGLPPVELFATPMSRPAAPSAPQPWSAAPAAEAWSPTPAPPWLQAPAPAASPGTRRAPSAVLRLEPMLDAQHLSPEARAQETLVESYARASARLTTDMADLRDERDLALRRLDDLRQALLAAHDVVAGQPLDTTLREILGHMAAAAGARHASLLVPLPTGAFHAALLRGLGQDPLLRMPPGPRHVTDQFRHEAEPRLHHADDSLDLGDALMRATPPFDALLAVPLRTTRGLQALAMLYYTADDVRPRADILEHLGLIADTLSSALELASATVALQQDEEMRQLALVGSAAMRGLEEVLAPLLLFRDRLGALRRRTDAPDWLQKECDRLIPTLSRALGQSRSLLGFGRGDIQREIVDTNELLSDQRAQGMDVQIPTGLMLWGDPALLRLALAALVERVRDAGGEPVRVVLDTPQRRVRTRIGPGVLPEFCDEVGLAFVHKVLGLHKSELTTESDPQGTWFSFSIDPA